MDRRIILAAGHGGSSPGAQARGHSEAAECIDIVNRTADKLRIDGRLEVVVVPHTLDLKDEIRWINARFTKQSGYAAEVHKNSGGPTANGVEAWHLTGSQEGAKKADIVLKELARVSRLKNRGIKKDVDYSLGRLGWVRQTKPLPGLFECGFITHDHFMNESLRRRSLPRVPGAVQPSGHSGSAVPGDPDRRHADRRLQGSRERVPRLAQRRR